MALIKFNNNATYTYQLTSFSRNTYFSDGNIRADVNINLGTVSEANSNIYDLGTNRITSIIFINDQTEEIFYTLSNLDYEIEVISETWDEDHLNLNVTLRIPVVTEEE